MKCSNPAEPNKKGGNLSSTESTTVLSRKELVLLKRIIIFLSNERNFDILFGYILDAAIEFTQAEGATIYAVDEENQQLKFIKIYNSVMNISLNAYDITWPPIPLYVEDNQPNLSNLATLCYHQKKSFNFPDVYEQDVFDNSGTIKYDNRNNYRTRSIVAIPMMDHKDNIIGIIQLINAQDMEGNIISFRYNDVKNLEVLSSIAAILMNNHKLITDLQITFHQFIKSIAWAIDKKSKNFSGHIERVSKLVNIFAEEINTRSGEDSRFGNFRFSKDDLEELNIAGMMHDLGKIITPMAVLDKSSKLETIFDRIELIKERIAHIDSLVCFDRTKADENRASVLQELRCRLKKYEEFLVRINTGRDYLTDKDKQFLKEIHDFRYYYDEREYYIINENEYYNLTIRIGTLNREDLAIIREHAYVTGKMLDQIKFPKYLANAPLYAESHHEKLNGTGYPKGLTASEIPFQSRILALADIFEALTAVRPYKESKTLTETYAILEKMVADNEIDGDLFLFAVQNGVFLKYARLFLEEDQIDVK
jgi:HD-GYP domain-containing protein (c-di-GMP phosphodiesterase class II)